MRVVDPSHFPGFIKQRRIPTTAQLEITSQCHLACPHCKSVVGEKSGELDTQAWKDVMAELKKIGTTTINFTGGEVFLRPDFLELCQHASQQGFKVHLITTGTLITPPRAAALQKIKNLKRLAVSLYALRPQAHGAVTQADTLKKSLSTLLWLRRLGLPAEAQAVLMAPNWRDILPLKAFLDERGIPFRYSLVVFPRDDGDPLTQVMQAPTWVLAHLSQVLKPFAQESFHCGALDPDGPVCSAGRTVVGVTARGDYLPCPAFRHTFGGVGQGPLSAMWRQSPGLDRVLNLKKSQTVCHACEVSRQCFHCAGLALAQAGNDLEKLHHPQAACELTYARKRGALIGC